MGNSKLDINLDSNDQSAISIAMASIAEETVEVGSILSVMQNKNSGLYLSTKKFLTLIEKSRSQTYLIDGDMTIGIGFDLTANSQTSNGLLACQEILSNMGLDYNLAIHGVGYPPNGLTLSNIDTLFSYSLNGYVDQSGVNLLTAKTKLLYLKLISNGFDDYSILPMRYVVALQSMAFQNINLIGSGLCNAIKISLQTGNDLNAVTEIIEHENRLDATDVAGIQNRRLKEAAMLHGNPSDVHLSYRQYMKIKNYLSSQGIEVVPINGDPTDYPTTIGQPQLTFGGDPEPVQIANDIDPINFGTAKRDEMNLEGQKNPVALGGNDDDVMNTANSSVFDEKGKSENSFPYLAGNLGNDFYQIQSSDVTIISDVDHRGQIMIDGQVLQGVAIATNTTGQYQLIIDGQVYTLTRDNSGTLPGLSSKLCK